MTFRMIGHDHHNNNIHQEMLHWPRHTGLHMLYESYNAEKFGHFLGDELLPLYRLNDTFGLTDQLNNDGIQVWRWVDHHPNNVDPCLSVNDSQRCGENYQRLFPLLSPRPLHLLGPTNASFCISDLMVGIGALSDHCEDITYHGRNHDKTAQCNYGNSHQLWQFRNHMLANAAAALLLLHNNASHSRTIDPRSSSPIPSLPLIVVITRRGSKKSYRLPSNYEQVMTNAVALLNHSLALVDITSLDINEQISLISRARILISPAGGISFIGFFLPKGAAMLLFTDPLEEGYLDFGLYSAFYVKVSYVHTHKQQPVELADMVNRLQYLLENVQAFGG